MKELIMYRCEICGNLICMIEDSGVVPECCGTEMTRITANTEDAAVEKHVPVIRRNGETIEILVGGQPHPMTPQHYISLIFLLTSGGMYLHSLNPGDTPGTAFSIRPEEDVLSAYAWCNIHGLWKS